MAEPHDGVIRKTEKEDSGIEEFLYIALIEEPLQSYVYKRKVNKGSEITYYQNFLQA